MIDLHKEDKNLSTFQHVLVDVLPVYTIVMCFSLRDTRGRRQTSMSTKVKLSNIMYNKKISSTSNLLW